MLNNLNDRERAIVQMRFGLSDGTPKNLSEVGRIYGIGRERVRQIEKRAMEKMQSCNIAEQLVD